MELTIETHPQVIKILVVEDRPQHLKLLEEFFSNFGYAVIPQSRADLAVELYLNMSHECDLVVMDLSMEEGIDGIEAASRMQQQRPDLPVIIVSAHANLPTWHEQAERAGLTIVEWVDKPLNRENRKKMMNAVAHAIPPSRRPWKTLVRVVAIDEANDRLKVFVPGWNPHEGVTVPLTKDILRLQPNHGDHFYARVNVGASVAEDLYFRNWEKI